MAAQTESVHLKRNKTSYSVDLLCVFVFQELLNRYERAIYASLSGNLKPVI